MNLTDLVESDGIFCHEVRYCFFIVSDDVRQ